MLTLGTLTLTNDPYISIDYNYNATSNGTIIGGTKSITLTGSIVSTNPADLMAEAKNLNDWFNNTSNRTLSSVTIRGVSYPYAIIESVSINNADWINKIGYTIVLRVPIEASSSLPSNIFGLSYTNNIKSLEITESIDVTSDKNDTYYVTNTGINTINGSVRWEIKISLSCLKDNTNSAIINAENVLRNILITTPNRAEFDEYKTWNMFLQARSLNINAANGSLEFALTAMLTPATLQYNCLVSFAHTYNHNYINNTHSRNLNVDIEGLIPIVWTDIIDISSSCITGKYETANTLALVLSEAYKNPTSHSSVDLLLNLLDCPVTCNVIDNSLCWAPRNFTMSGSIVDGTCSVAMEWSADNENCNSNGITTEVALTTSNFKLATHTYTGWFLSYPIIQNLNCTLPTQRDYTITAKSRYQCPTSLTKLAAEQEAQAIISSIPNTFFKINDTRTQDNTSYTIRMSWIEVCP